MIISVASGKGGTGKTTVAVSLALSIAEKASGRGVQLLDCDVEEPNCHIFIKPGIETTEAVHIPVPEIDEEICDFCGKCREVCAYNAIAVIPPSETSGSGKVLVFPELCHGCGSCVYFCPRDAIKEVNRQIGVVEKGKKGSLEFVYGKLNIGEAMAPPLIRAVKQNIDPDKTVILDAPPGTSCPVITAINESHFCILVTEPTPFGLYDLSLAVDVVRKMEVSFGVVINRCGLGNEDVDKFCQKENIPVLAKIPFSREIAAAYSRGDIIIDAFPQYKEIFYGLFENIKTRIR
jgi:MinD superfamily P-loop ATPase